MNALRAGLATSITLAAALLVGSAVRLELGARTSLAAAAQARAEAAAVRAAARAAADAQVAEINRLLAEIEACIARVLRDEDRGSWTCRLPPADQVRHARAALEEVRRREAELRRRIAELRRAR